MTTSMKNATFINQNCTCVTLNQEKLKDQLEKTGLLKGIYQEIILTRPYLFSSTMVLISEEDSEKMKRLIEIIENIIHSHDFEQKIFQDVPEVARFNPRTKGVFMGYDFHLTESGPKLIEINTNAGGVLLNAELAQAQSYCCIEVSIDEHLEEKIFQTFISEWTLERGGTKPKRIAIVDEKFRDQFLYPEFLLFQHLFQERGISCDIVEPHELRIASEGLSGPNGAIDMVYNRLTDFYLDAPELAILKEAYLSDLVVLTPNPHHHALYARKTNLEIFRDPSFLEKQKLSFDDKQLLLDIIPHSQRVLYKDLDTLWAQRKDFFFKPVSGFGSRGSYRGDKITRRVWEDISRHNYIAQRMVPPSYKLVDVDGKQVVLKVDIRAYTYNSQVILFAARLYSGQTTNFRTEGGGFAPVFTTP